MSEIQRLVTAAAAVVLLLAGCAATTPFPTAESEPSISAAVEPEAVVYPDPVGLVDLWRVADAEGAGTDVWLRLGADQFYVWADCGIGAGMWRAADGQFVASVSSGQGPGPACLTQEGTEPSLEWLEQSAAFRPADGGWELVDRDGAVTARLFRDPSSAPWYPADQMLENISVPPVVTDAVRAQFASVPAELPPGVSPADHLVGEWRVADEVGAFDEPFLRFEDDGSWSGETCVPGGGRWSLVADGRLLVASALAVPAILCSQPNVTGWIALAARVGITDDGALQFYDASGALLGELIRA